MAIHTSWWLEESQGEEPVSCQKPTGLYKVAPPKRLPCYQRPAQKAEGSQCTSLNTSTFQGSDQEVTDMGKIC